LDRSPLALFTKAPVKKGGTKIFKVPRDIEAQQLLASPLKRGTGGGSPEIYKSLETASKLGYHKLKF
jgi:hypothetical protein